MDKQYTKSSLREAYDYSERRLVENHTTGDKVAVSTPIVLTHESTTNLANLESKLEGEESVLFNAYSERAENDYYVSGTFYHGPTNSSVKIKANKGHISIYHDDKKLSFEVITKIFEYIQSAVGAKLRPVVPK